ncbi:hypothetical protein TNCV_1761931 [Trichonephila clavipes]|nr:hypothetical protein TNCV_1761931 [Trichonephila clavipes]
MFDSSSYNNPTPLAHADTSRQWDFQGELPKNIGRWVNSGVIPEFKRMPPSLRKKVIKGYKPRRHAVVLWGKQHMRLTWTCHKFSVALTQDG